MGTVRYVILSALFVIGYDIYFFAIEDSLGYESIFNVILFAFAYLVQKRAKSIDRRMNQYALLFSLLYSSALVVGRFLYDSNDLRTIYGSTGSVIAFGICFLGFTAIFRAIFSIVYDRILIYCIRAEEKQKRWKIFQIPQTVLWGFIFVSWLPVFLAFYPGICSYDSNSQTTQAMQGIAHYTRYHPPLHTMIWAGCLKIADFIHLHPLCIYSLLQMLLLSLVFSKMIVVLIQRGLNNRCILLGILFVSINPIMAIFSFEMTKDAFLTVFFVLCSLYLLELAEDSERFLSKKLNWGKLIVTLLILCLFRNNMVYVCVLCMPVAAFIMRQYWKQIIFLFAAPVFAYLIIDGFVYARLGIAEGNAREGLNVPIQQIAYAVNANEEEILPEERSGIDEYIPYDVILTSYNPRFADPIKFSFQTENYKTNKAGFWKIWFALGRKYPGAYLNAFLTLNLPYWYPDACPVDNYSDRQYVEIGMDSGAYYSISTDSKLPGLYSLYIKFADYEAIRNIPILSRVYLLAAPIWLLLFITVVLLLKRETSKILVLLPSICLWITYMAGPVSNFRYIFPIFALYPLIVGVMFNRSVAAVDLSGDGSCLRKAEK